MFKSGTPHCRSWMAKFSGDRFSVYGSFFRILWHRNTRLITSRLDFRSSYLPVRKLYETYTEKILCFLCMQIVAKDPRGVNIQREMNHVFNLQRVTCNLQLALPSCLTPSLKNFRNLREGQQRKPKWNVRGVLEWMARPRRRRGHAQKKNKKRVEVFESWNCTFPATKTVDALFSCRVRSAIIIYDSRMVVARHLMSGDRHMLAHGDGSRCR
jgi:hypothetical protein